jgi:hypothetical protein
MRQSFQFFWEYICLTKFVIIGKMYHTHTHTHTHTHRILFSIEFILQTFWWNLNTLYVTVQESCSVIKLNSNSRMIHTWEGLENSLSMLYEVIHPFTVESANIRSTLRCSVYRRSTASNTAAPGKLHLVRPTPGLIGIDPSHFSTSNTCRGINAVPKKYKFISHLYIRGAQILDVSSPWQLHLAR